MLRSPSSPSLQNLSSLSALLDHRDGRPRLRNRALSDTSDRTIVPESLKRNRQVASEVTHQVEQKPDWQERTTSPISVTKASRKPSTQLHRYPLQQHAENALSPQTLQALLVFLQLLSLVPATIGVLYCVWHSIFPLPLSTSSLNLSRRLEWLLSALWAALSGSYCHAMARGLTR